MSSLSLDHIAIAVESIAETLPLLELITGQTGSTRETNLEQGVELVFLGTGVGKVELLEPTDVDTPVGRFLAKRGPGLHHVAYRVNDLPAALKRLKANGVRLIDEEPRRGAHGHRIAFIHPRSTGGVLIELVEGSY
jgi:methylmalonyl-CoA/ethylmalonyl-CoA epimerase